MGADLKAWRGAFRSHRAVAGALTGGPSVIRPYLLLRAILDETDFDLILLDDADKNITQFFVLGQGPDGTEYNEGELTQRLLELAVPVLDDFTLIPCYALTAWRDGFAGWNPTGRSGIGDVYCTGRVRSHRDGSCAGPLERRSIHHRADAATSHVVGRTIWSTEWFLHTPDPGEFHEIHVYATDDSESTGDAYVLQVFVDGVRFVRRVGGVDTIIATDFTLPIPSDLDGAYHRVDFVVHKTAAKTRVRAYVDMDPTAWYDDLVVAGRPDGLRSELG